MLKKILGKSAAGTVVAGLVLAAAPAGVVSAPFLNVACGDYPDGVATTTTLTMPSASKYGRKNTATVEVETAVAGHVPTGKVQFKVKKNGKLKKKGSANLSGGTATKKIWRKLNANATYTVKVKYKPNCVDFKKSSDSQNYTVKKAKTKVNPKVKNGPQAKFSGKFKGSEGLNPKKGKAKFTVKRSNGSVVSTRTVAVKKNGTASVDMSNLGSGSYKLQVKYLGSKNFKPGKKTRNFQVS